MANIRLIRRRIRGIKNIAKITRAMEMIAASKMRKAQDRGLAGRAYSEKITQVIASLAAAPREAGANPLLQVRTPPKRIAWFHLAEALEGKPTPNPWSWSRTGDRWKLENTRTREMIEGFLNE